MGILLLEDKSLSIILFQPCVRSHNSRDVTTMFSSFRRCHQSDGGSQKEQKRRHGSIWIGRKTKWLFELNRSKSLAFYTFIVKHSNLWIKRPTISSFFMRIRAKNCLPAKTRTWSSTSSAWSSSVSTSPGRANTSARPPTPLARGPVTTFTSASSVSKLANYFSAQIFIHVQVVVQNLVFRNLNEFLRNQTELYGKDFKILSSAQDNEYPITHYLGLLFWKFLKNWAELWCLWTEFCEIRWRLPMHYQPPCWF